MKCDSIGVDLLHLWHAVMDTILPLPQEVMDELAEEKVSVGHQVGGGLDF